jgi:hypothetical protein
MFYGMPVAKERLPMVEKIPMTIIKSACMANPDSLEGCLETLHKDNIKIT